MIDKDDVDEPALQLNSSESKRPGSRRSFASGPINSTNELLNRISNLERQMQNKSMLEKDHVDDRIHELEHSVSQMATLISKEKDSAPKEKNSIKKDNEFKDANKIDGLELQLSKLVELMSKDPKLKQNDSDKAFASSDQRQSDNIAALENQISRLVEAMKSTSKDPSTVHIVQNIHKDRMDNLEAQVQELKNLKLNSSILPPPKNQKSKTNHDAISTSEDEITIPTRIPKLDESFNKSLQWVPVQNDLDPDSIPVLDRPPKRVTILNKKEQRTQASNLKLISALETEEKRLRDNESKYSERIKTLSAELAIRDEIQWKYNLISKQYGEMKTNFGTIVSEVKTLKKEIIEAKDELKKSEDEKKINESRTKELELQQNEYTSKYEILKKTNSHAFDELELCKKQLATVLESQTAHSQTRHNLESKLTRMEKEAAKSALKSLRERDILNHKLSSLQHDFSQTSISLDAARSEISRLESSHRSQQEKLRNQASYSQSQINDAVRLQTINLTASNNSSIDSLNKKLESMQHAYHALEMEYTSASRTHSSNIQSYQSKQLESESTKESQRVKIEALERKNEENASLIRDLVTLVKEQKERIGDLNAAHDRKFKEMTNGIREGEETYQRLQNENKRLKGSNEKFNEIQDALRRFKINNSDLENDKKEMDTKIKELAKDVQERDELIEGQKLKLSGLEGQVSELKEANQHTLQIKNKMLDDQNETLRHLKSSLESKVRAHHQTQIELNEAKSQLADEDVDQAVVDGFRTEVEWS